MEISDDTYWIDFRSFVNTNMNSHDMKNAVAGLGLKYNEGI